MTSQPSKLAPYSSLDEPLLAFAGGVAAVHAHPLRGLLKYGPYTKTALPAFTPRIRVAIAGPETSRADRGALLSSLRRRLGATDRREYLPDYPGFEAVFGVKLVPAEQGAQFSLPASLDNIETDEQEAHLRVRGAIVNLVSQLMSARDRYDVAVVHLPDSWEPGLRAEDFDARDELKARCAVEGIPTQVINDRTFEFGYHASRAWRLAIALYAKAGGTPWKLAPIPGVPDDTAYIGLAYALRGDPREAQFVTCCSQVFDTDGGGMQFVAYDARDPIDDHPSARRNPYLSRDDMRAVVARSLRLYQARNGGLVPSRVVIHKTTQFRDEEIAGASDALTAVRELECVEVTVDVAWRGVWLKAPRNAKGKGEPDGYPVRRGTMAPLSGTEALLWVAGNAPEASTSGNFYQGGKSIPTPLLLRRHAGGGPLELAANEALALSKMDWNNDALYDPVPVTIQYSKRLAQTVANVPTMRRGGISVPAFHVARRLLTTGRFHYPQNLLATISKRS